MKDGFSLKQVEPPEQFFKEISEGFMVAQEWLKSQKDVQSTKDSKFWLHVVYYELGQISKMLCYREAHPKSGRCGSKEDMRTAIGDALANIIVLASTLNVDSFQAITEAMTRLHNTEWNKH